MRRLNPLIDGVMRTGASPCRGCILMVITTPWAAKFDGLSNPQFYERTFLEPLRTAIGGAPMQETDEGSPCETTR